MPGAVAASAASGTGSVSVADGSGYRPVRMDVAATWLVDEGRGVEVPSDTWEARVRLPWEMDQLLRESDGRPTTWTTVDGCQDRYSSSYYDGVVAVNHVDARARCSVTDATAPVLVTVAGEGGGTRVALTIEVVSTGTPVPGGSAIVDVDLPVDHGGEESREYVVAPVEVGTRVVLDLSIPNLVRSGAFVPSYVRRDGTGTRPSTMTARHAAGDPAVDVALPGAVEDGDWAVLTQTETLDDLTRHVRISVPLRHAVVAEPVDAYVTHVYGDLFGRAPEPAGLAGWSQALRAGTPYSAVADAITASAEFRSGLIRESYLHYLGRSPDAAGAAGWLDAMGRGMPIQQMESGFIASQEYFLFSGGTIEGWVEALYLDVLGREASPDEVAGWRTAIERGAGRAQVATGFLYSTEHLSTVVGAYYRELLHREADHSGVLGWVRALQAGERSERIVSGIVASPEYRAGVPLP
ncbi:hypothetical protein Cma02nite_27480 [Cellulomonas marina]|nr:hypothetical protein Cma02nite_27480 [Cellulomonas marina]